jgi:hypothetical protein
MKRHLFSIIWNPFKQLNQEILKISFIYNFYTNFLLKFTDFFLKHYYWFTLVELISRLTLLIGFILDIFINYKLYLTSKFIYLLIFIYVKKYILYLIDYKRKEKITFFLESIELRQKLFGIVLPLEGFIHVQTNKIIDNKPLMQYHFVFQSDHIKKLIKEYNVQPGQRINVKNLMNSTQKILNWVFLLTEILYRDKRFQAKFKIANILIYTIYLISWSYILFISRHTFHFTNIEIQFLQNFQEICEPFSDTKLWFFKYK